MKKRTLMLFLLLLLIFILPTAAAYMFYLHPQWLGKTLTNHGQFIKPALYLPGFTPTKKWRLALIYKNDCLQECLKELDELARIRLALGRRLRAVEIWLFTEQEKQISKKTLSTFKQNDINVAQLAKQDETLSSNCILIVNPEGYGILQYALDASPQAIYQDLKHLLSINGKDSAS